MNTEKTKRLVRLSMVSGLCLAVGAWIAFAQANLFPSLLNECVVAHPWLLHNGFVEYQHLPDQKSPLLPLVLSWLLPVFNHDPARIARALHTLVICAVVLVSMLWVYRHSHRWAVVVTGVFLLTWSNSFGLWATLYYDVVLAPLYLLVFALTVAYMGKPGAWTLGLGGLLTGLAILTKQQGVLLTLPIAVLLVTELVKRRATWRRIVGHGLVYAAGLLLPIAAYAWFYYRQAGSFADLIYWVFTSNLAGPYASHGAALPSAAHIVAMVPALLMLIPFASSIVWPAADMKPDRSARLLMLAMFVLSAFLIYPRYSTRHWPAALPFLAMLSGISVADLVRAGRRLRAPALMSIGAAVVMLWATMAALAYLPAIRQPRGAEWGEYSSLITLADQVRERIPADGQVALVPLDESNANLSYLLGRFPQHYWLLYYPWHLNPVTIQSWISTMDEEQPAILLYFPGQADLATYAPDILEYVQAHYRLADTVQLQNGGQVQIMLREPVPGQ